MAFHRLPSPSIAGMLPSIAEKFYETAAADPPGVKELCDPAAANEVASQVAGALSKGIQVAQ